MSDGRSTSRSLRIPLDLDDKIIAYQKKTQSPSLTQATISLINLGLRVDELVVKFELDPEEEERVKKASKDSISKILKEEVMFEDLNDLNNEQLNSALEVIRAVRSMRGLGSLRRGNLDFGEY